jgi:hypothetical protein
MMNIKDMKTLGLKEMHNFQVEALLEFVHDALNLAAMTGDKDIVADVEQSADELIRLFGGTGVSVTFQDDH